MLTAALLSLLATATPSATRPPAPDGWLARPAPGEKSHEWSCANHAFTEWKVSAPDGKLVISALSRRESSPPLPFEPALESGEHPQTFKGARAIHRVSDGFVVGFYRGEFGGGLYWFSRDGKKHVRLSPGGEYFPESVVGIVEHWDTIYVFQGLAHLRQRRGRVLAVRRDSKRQWTVTVLVDLGTAPGVVTVEKPGTWLLATSDGLLRVAADGSVERVWDMEPMGYLHPNSIVRTRDGIVHVGMRAWVARLIPSSAGKPEVDILAPVSCARYGSGKADPRRLKPEDCRCSDGVDAGARSF